VERDYETHLLRRSYREDRKVKNETVANLPQAGRSPGSSTRSCGYQMLTQSSGRGTGTRTSHDFPLFCLSHRPRQIALKRSCHLPLKVTP